MRERWFSTRRTRERSILEEDTNLLPLGRGRQNTVTDSSTTTCRFEGKEDDQRAWESLPELSCAGVWKLVNVGYGSKKGLALLVSLASF